jgi:hypothetical protein
MTEVSTELLIYAAALYVGVNLPNWVNSLATKQVKETNNSKRKEKEETLQKIYESTVDFLQNLGSDSSDCSHHISSHFDGGSCDGGTSHFDGGSCDGGTGGDV